VLPGFRLSLGLTLSYLSLLVLVPLSTLVLRAATLGGDTFWAAVSAPRVLHACGLSLGAALAATMLNALLGGVSPGASCATRSQGAGSPMPWSTCRWRCRRPSRA
jgi:ABC-type sulfate transport system permease component